MRAKNVGCNGTVNCQIVCEDRYNADSMEPRGYILKSANLQTGNMELATCQKSYLNDIFFRTFGPSEMEGAATYKV